MNFLDLLEKQGDKVELNEMILVKKKLPARVTRPIPACMYDETLELDYEVFNILAWVIARRENSEITLDEVGSHIGMGNSDKLRSIVKEVYYFYTGKTREEVEEVGQESQEDDAEDDAEGDNKAENPPQPSPLNDS